MHWVWHDCKASELDRDCSNSFLGGDTAPVLDIVCCLRGGLTLRVSTITWDCLSIPSLYVLVTCYVDHGNTFVVRSRLVLLARLRIKVCT